MASDVRRDAKMASRSSSRFTASFSRSSAANRTRSGSASAGRSRSACRNRWSIPILPRAAASNKRYGAVELYWSGSITSPRRMAPALFFLEHADRDLGRHLAMQPNHDLVLAERLNRIVELDLTPVNVVALRFQAVGDVLGSHRSEELIVFAGLLADGDGNRVQHLRQIGRARMLLGIALQVRLALLLHYLLVGFTGGHGQPLGQQIIACVAG